MKILLTGTAAYGPFTKESDIDIVMMYYDAENVKTALSLNGLEILEDQRNINPAYKGFGFMVGDRKIQVICVDTSEMMDCWEYMTEKMKERLPIINKKTRIEICNNLRKRKDDK